MKFSIKPILLYIVYMLCCMTFIGLIIVQHAESDDKDIKENVRLKRSRPPNAYYYEEQRPVIIRAESFMAPQANEGNSDDYEQQDNFSSSSNDLAEPQAIMPYAQVAPAQTMNSPLNNFLEIFKDLNKLWHIYKAFSAALNDQTNMTNQTVIHPRGTYDKSREKRYIQGDPLKGYYDFVITEGSYKFWAVFQVGTAILIIYSTFAAIYYSKVNPLTTDYDYTDYLGGARGFNADTIDFDDVEENAQESSENSKTWYANLAPHIGGALKHVLELLEKLPSDYETKIESNQQQDQGIKHQELSGYELHTKKLKRQIFNAM